MTAAIVTDYRTLRVREGVLRVARLLGNFLLAVFGVVLLGTTEELTGQDRHTG